MIQILKENDSKFKIPYPAKLMEGENKNLFSQMQDKTHVVILCMDKISSILLSQAKLR